MFKALLSPRFSEGVELSARGNLEVALPDEDADALEIICLVLHHRNEVKVFDTSVALLKTIALLSDKYDLALALKQTAQVWISDLEAQYPSFRQDLLVSAYLLQHAPMFEMVGNGLVWYAKKIHPYKAKGAMDAASIFEEVFSTSIVGRAQDTITRLKHFSNRRPTRSEAGSYSTDCYVR